MKTLNVILIAMLWSISPLGEAKVGVPYAISQDVNIYVAFIVCLIANILVFPVMMFLNSSIVSLARPTFSIVAVKALTIPRRNRSAFTLYTS